MNHFDIRLTTQELDYIANTLSQRPWAEVNTLLTNLKGQIDYQQKVEATPKIDPSQHTTAQYGNGLDHTAVQPVN